MTRSARSQGDVLTLANIGGTSYDIVSKRCCYLSLNKGVEIHVKRDVLSR